MGAHYLSNSGGERLSSPRDRSRLSGADGYQCVLSVRSLWFYSRRRIEDVCHNFGGGVLIRAFCSGAKTRVYYISTSEGNGC